MSTESDPAKVPMVLVADDEIHTTVMLERIFEREGYHVQSVNDGVSALETARRIVPDLILLDIQMPGMSGFDVLRGLRDNKSTASIPTILVTAKARKPSDVAHGLNLGADDYIYKPFDPRELVARAESKMKARQLEENLQRRTQELQALLRLGEELNQSLEVHELLELVLFLTLDLLPGTLASIYQFDRQEEVVAYRFQTIHDRDTYKYNADKILNTFLEIRRPVLWPHESALTDEFVSGMVVPLQHGTHLLGMLMVVSENELYDENHLRLFTGIGRQTALALRNAELYEILSEHAEHLEEMVAARTADLQSAQQMLIRSEKLASIGHLAASIAHEINNPLQPIRIHLEHITEDVQNKDPVDLVEIENIQESIERITRIVSQLLDFAGKRTSDSDVNFLDLDRILRGVIRLNQKLFEQNKIKLESFIDPLPQIYGSKDQLEQVFMNIILNAHAAMTSGGKLTISANAEDQQVSIRFTDTGYGIPPDKINNIFDPFYSTKQDGTGLGLFVSYGIIQNHQGDIQVESNVGVGTTFTIQLPVDTQPEKIMQQRSNEPDMS